MTGASDGDLETLRNEVDTLMGRCVLNLQYYERGMKDLIACHDVSGPVDAEEETRIAATTDTSRMTLGALAGQVFGSYLTTEEKRAIKEQQALDEASYDLPEDAPFSFRARFQITLSEEDFTQTEASLRDFVSLRNDLIHHFIERHDLTTLSGCHNAKAALTEARARINRHIAELRQWLEWLEENRVRMQEAMKSEVVRDLLINGTHGPRQ